MDPIINFFFYYYNLNHKSVIRKSVFFNNFVFYNSDSYLIAIFLYGLEQISYFVDYFYLGVQYDLFCQEISYVLERLAFGYMSSVYI
jgi:hypothetical protein